MNMKVPSSSTPAAAAAPAQTQKAAQAPQTQSAQGSAPAAAGAGEQKSALQDRLQKDGFEGAGMTRCFPMPPLGRPGETMDFGDRKNAADLKDTLSSPLNQVRVQLGEKDETITRGKDGSYTGPNGEPLAQVKLNDGTTAYVDPNTNQYYLTDDSPNLLGRVQATGPYPLPADAQFSNSHFSEADVKGIQRHAASGSVFDFPSHKFPFPPIDLPIDRIQLTAADLKDGGQ
jgi:hypothetical protein